jgi:exodeoxyribonuclease V alpha subunit
MLNEELQKVLNPEEQEPSQVNMGSFTIRRGDRVMVKKNDYENDIFNGDIGKVTSIGAGRVRFEVDDRVIDLGVDEIEEKLKLAYSISVHKSQGQEYPFIILPFINQFGKNMLQRNLLYTALTRAKEKVIVLGHGSAIERAINNSSVTKRNTKLAERINICCQRKKNDSTQESPGDPKSSPNAQNPMELSSSKKEELSTMDSANV